MSWSRRLVRGSSSRCSMLRQTCRIPCDMLYLRCISRSCTLLPAENKEPRKDGTEISMDTCEKIERLMMVSRLAKRAASNPLAKVSVISDDRSGVGLCKCGSAAGVRFFFCRCTFYQPYPVPQSKCGRLLWGNVPSWRATSSNAVFRRI